MIIKAQIISDNCAEAAGIRLVVSRGDPIFALCRRLIEAGHDPEAKLEAFRGDRLAFIVRTLRVGAGLTVIEGEGRPKIVKWQPHPLAGMQPPIEFSEQPATTLAADTENVLAAA